MLALASRFHGVSLSQDDRKVLCKALKRNRKSLESAGLKEDDITLLLLGNALSVQSGAELRNS